MHDAASEHFMGVSPGPAKRGKGMTTQAAGSGQSVVSDRVEKIVADLLVITSKQIGLFGKIGVFYLLWVG